MIENFKNEPPMPFRELNYDELGAKLDSTTTTSIAVRGDKKSPTKKNSAKAPPLSTSFMSTRIG
jgi:hypothetical protein